MTDELFNRKKLIFNTLIPYGFKRIENCYKYTTDILNGQFALSIFIMDDGAVDTIIIDKETEDEYTLYKTNAAGAFVGEVRRCCEKVLSDISEKCYETDIFKAEQSKTVIDYVRKTYGDELEFLWVKSPGNAVWRRKDNSKWYGAMLTIAKSKLGSDSDEIVEIIDLRLQPEQITEIVNKDYYYQGWHMNKKNWYTMILDQSISNDEICERIDISYRLAKKHDRN